MKIIVKNCKDCAFRASFNDRNNYCCQLSDIDFINLEGNKEWCELNKQKVIVKKFIKKRIEF